MTKDKALRMALEALEVATTPMAKDRQEVLRAQAAIREVLAQPEPAVQGEPVAWRYALDASVEGPRWIYIDKGPHKWLQGPEMVNALIEPLYTTPQPAVPERKPLTEEELYKVFPAIASYTEANKTLYRSIARAIEAAHGITGESK